MTEFGGDSEPDAGLGDSTITAPIDTLPNELITHIFTMGSTSEPPHVYSQTNHSLPFPLLVSSVSRRWRDTAISSQPLWSRLLFTADPLTDSWISCLFLPRSGAYPLDICINLVHGDRAMEQILEIILPHHERWSTLCVIPWEAFELTLRVIRDISVPLLQHVKILGPHNAQILVHTSHTPFFQLGAPVLASVSLRNICVECGPPLANLTAFLFDYQGTLSQQCLESIVAASPGFRILRLALQSFEGSGQGPIHIPSLRELSFEFGNCAPNDDFVRLFAIIIAPDLESLELAFWYERDASRFLFHCTQSPSYPRPRTLKLSRLNPVTLSSYHALFALFPTVTSLFLLDGNSTPALSQLPALKHITYGHNPSLFPWFNAIKEREDSFIEWICGHVRGCYGTPQAMESVRTNRSAHKIRETIGRLVNVVGLADGADSLHDSWAEEDEDVIGSLATQLDDDFYVEHGGTFEGIWSD